MQAISFAFLKIIVFILLSQLLFFEIAIKRNYNYNLQE
jgi:hypothetical protein